MKIARMKERRKKKEGGATRKEEGDDIILDDVTSIEEVTIQPAEKELRRGSLEDNNFNRARECLLKHGVVVLEGVMPQDKCNMLHEKMREDLQRILALPTERQTTNYSPGHVWVKYINII